MSPQFSQNKPANIPVIQVESLFKQFHTSRGELPVLENISLSVQAGEILAIVGKSGSGKSTLLNIISALEEPTTGTVKLCGPVGYVPQKDLLLPWRTVMENVLLPIEIIDGDLKAAAIHARGLLTKHDLDEFAESYPTEISGGMRQKVALIRTLIQNSNIILFDEPFSAVDFAARLQLVRDVRSFMTSAQKSAIFVSHNIEEAIAIADKLIVVSNRPARTVYSSDIDIPEVHRDPIGVRQSKQFQTIFAEVWSVLRHHL